MKLSLSDFDYDLPKELIAQKPQRPRDHSRLFVLSRREQKFEHRHFFDIIDYLNPDDVLVLNNTKVFPARLLGKKQSTNGAVEVFLLRQHPIQGWLCLVGTKGCQAGLVIDFSHGLVGVVKENNQDGTWRIEFNQCEPEFMQTVKKIGQVPLPPYIKRTDEIKTDKQSYQTVFADNLKQGSVAAPTAGLHFTSKLLAKIKDKGIKVEYVTLHVGLGTFAAVKTENVVEHKMHAEWYEVEQAVIDRVKNAKAAGHRIITVGTTATRTLETVWGNQKKLSGWTDIYIYPGYKFRIVDGLITNFHTPKSTLMMLISAFVQNEMSGELSGIDVVQAAYREAVEKKYRFFSYGDAMFIV